MQNAIITADHIGKIIDTLILIVVAVGASAALWVTANLLFNQVRSNWVRFNALIGYAVGFLLLLILQGNRLLKANGPDGSSITELGELLWTPFFGGFLFAAVAYVLSTTNNVNQRLWIGAGSGLALGLIIGARLAEQAQPQLEILTLLISTIVFGGIGAAIAVLRGRQYQPTLVVGSAIGAFIGGFGLPKVGNTYAAPVGAAQEPSESAATELVLLSSGSVWEAIITTGIVGALFGAWVGLMKNAGVVGRARIDAKSRAVIFLTPAMTFLTIAIVTPTLITIWLSLKDNESVRFVWFENYGTVFTDRDSFDVSNWTSIFTSRLFWLGIIIGAAGLLIGLTIRRRTGSGFTAGGPAFFPLAIAIVFVVFAAVSVLRGTFMNNVWWVFAVTLFSTGLGLAIAVLADRAKLESVAKSIIFMPMAISLVGASIIWRFVYTARDTSKSQTGVLNAIWVQLGKWSTGEGLLNLLGTILVWVLVLVAITSIARCLTARQYDKLPIRVLTVLFLGWIAIRFTFDGIGGFRTNSAGVLVPDTIDFVQDPPFNNFWLLLILIWIQTGFAMVILSAAIKAVPTELIEAAKVDGATESQVFWRVTLPQISTTIGVVVTATIVSVMKVYDIIKVVTNGNFGTQVLANDMFQEAFQFSNPEIGATLAVILFLSLLPIMILNIRRMQKEV